MTFYADIILPVPLNQLFTYRIPDPLQQIAVEGARGQGYMCHWARVAGSPA